jgi:hypothetical protein
MATLTNIKAALTSGSNIFHGGKRIDNVSIARARAWFESTHAALLNGRSMAPDDLSAWLGDLLSQHVVEFEKFAAERALSTPAELDE